MFNQYSLFLPIQHTNVDTDLTNSDKKNVWNQCFINLTNENIVELLDSMSIDLLVKHHIIINLQFYVFEEMSDCDSQLKINYHSDNDEIVRKYNEQDYLTAANIVKYFHNMGMREKIATIVTNKYLITPEEYEKLMENAVEEYRVLYFPTC